MRSSGISMQSINKQVRDNGLRAVHILRLQSRRRGFSQHMILVLTCV